MAVTDYLSGDGSVANPYLIHNAAAAQAFFSLTEPCFKTNAYFHVVADINCASFTLPSVVASTSNHQWQARLYGNGHKLTNISVPGTGFCFISGSTVGVLDNISLHFSKCASSGFVYTASSAYRWDIVNNVKVFCDSGIFLIRGSLVGQATNYLTNQSSFPASPVDSVSSSVYFCLPSTVTPDWSGGVMLVGDARFIPDNYPTLSANDWFMDGVTLPALIPDGRPDLTQRYGVKGVTRVAGAGRPRDIAIMTAAYLGVLKKLKSSSDGSYLVNFYDVSDPLMIIHYDDYGFPLALSTAYAIGDIIHPTTPNGYRYICTTAGTSGNSSPTEPWSTTTSLISGSAIFTPVPVYAAETLLVQPHMYDFLTGLPVE